MNNEYPVFVPTKGRYKTLHTIKAFESIGVRYKAVIEKQEYTQYAEAIGKDNLIVVPHQNKGLTTTRNWIWDYAENELKTPYFWTFDDNIREFYRLHQNIKYRIASPTFLKVMEDFATRYENLVVSGMQYEMFVPRKRKHKPYTLNTRVYSNMLIKADSGYRNELFYNDDTDLCLRILKDGNCTLQFYAFLANKIATMTVKGGMTDYYKKTKQGDGRLLMAQALMEKHPDVTQIVRKWGRWQHKVDYSKFRNNKLRKKPKVAIPIGMNNYGMNLKRSKVGID